MSSYDEGKRRQWEAARAAIDARQAGSRQVSPPVILSLVESPDSIRAWLEAKQPHEIAGEYQTPDNSVLANYLWDVAGVYVLAFGAELWTLHTARITLPAWCRELSIVEAERFRSHRPVEASWTAAEALLMLQEVERRVGSN